MRKTECKPVAEKERLEMLRTFERSERMLINGTCLAIEIEPAIRKSINNYTEKYNQVVWEAQDLSEKGKECCYHSIREEERKLYRKMWRLLLKYSTNKIK